MKKPPPILDRIVDVVLAYRPKKKKARVRKNSKSKASARAKTAVEKIASKLVNGQLIADNKPTGTTVPAVPVESKR